MNKNFFKKNKLVLLLLSITILIGFYLRVGGVLTKSFAFTYDVGRDMLALNQLVYVHKIPLIGQTTGLHGLFYGPWWYYILSVPYFLSSGNPVGVAFFMAISGIATVITLFLLGKKAESTSLGLFMAYFSSISVALVAASAQIWNPNLAPLFLALILYVLMLIDNKKKRNNLHLFFLGLLLSLSMDMEIVYGALLLISTVVFALLFKRYSLNIKSIASFIFGFVLILAPRILFDIRHQFLMTNNLLSVVSGKSNPDSTFVFGLRLERIRDLISIWSETITGGVGPIGLLAILFTIGAIIIFWKKFNNIEKEIIKYGICIIAVYAIGLSFFLKDVWPHYLVGFPVILVVMFSVAVYGVYKYAKYGRIIALVIIAGIFWINVQPMQKVASFGKPVFEGDAAVYRNQLNAVDYVYNNANGRKFNYIMYTPPLNDYTYKYLFLWYGQKKYGYQPSTNTQKLFFVIMEPDFQNPQRLKDWLKLRVGDGKIVKEQEVKGGIIIQTRTR